MRKTVSRCSGPTGLPGLPQHTAGVVPICTEELGRFRRKIYVGIGGQMSNPELGFL